MELVNGYETKTTFFEDFTIADKFGIDAIKDTYNRAFNEWKGDYVYLTELVLVLNHKIWEYFGKGNEEYAKIYDELWKKTDEYAYENLKGEELTYYFEITD